MASSIVITISGITSTGRWQSRDSRRPFATFPRRYSPGRCSQRSQPAPFAFAFLLLRKEYPQIETTVRMCFGNSYRHLNSGNELTDIPKTRRRWFYKQHDAIAFRVLNTQRKGFLNGGSNRLRTTGGFKLFLHVICKHTAHGSRRGKPLDYMWASRDIFGRASFKTRWSRLQGMINGQHI